MAFASGVPSPAGFEANRSPFGPSLNEVPPSESA
jgi:hypothetical protein